MTKHKIILTTLGVLLLKSMALLLIAKQNLGYSGNLWTILVDEFLSLLVIIIILGYKKDSTINLNSFKSVLSVIIQILLAHYILILLLNLVMDRFKMELIYSLLFYKLLEALIFSVLCTFYYSRIQKT